MPLSLTIKNDTILPPLSPLDNYPVSFLKSWERGLKRKNFTLVHATNSNKHTALLERNANTLFSEWDILSCSLVDYANRGDAAFSSSANGAHPLHLELEVPVQNILGTHIKDVAFPNHVGRKWSNPTGQVLDKAALTRHIFSGIDKFSCKIHPHKGFNQLMHFQEFILQGFRCGAMGHNEVLLIGRPDVNYYGNLPCTREIKVKGISYVPAHLLSLYSSSFSGGDDFACKKVTEQIEKDFQALRHLIRLNHFKHFTHRLCNSQGACFDILNNLLLQHFTPAEHGVYQI